MLFMILLTINLILNMTVRGYILRGRLRVQLLKLVLCFFVRFSLEDMLSNEINFEKNFLKAHLKIS